MPGMLPMGFQPPPPMPMGGGMPMGGMPMGAPMPAQEMAAPVRGVGITFDQEINQKTGMAKVFIKRIREGSSADQSDSLEVGDTVITVNGKSVYGKPLSVLRTLIPGPLNSVVKIGFQSESGTRTEVELLRTTEKGNRASNPVFARPEMVSDTPSIALGDEAGTYNQRAMPGAEEWEKRVDHNKGYVFWVNHQSKKIAYVDPTKPRAPRPPGGGAPPPPNPPQSYSTLPDAPAPPPPPSEGYDMAATTQV